MNSSGIDLTWLLERSAKHETKDEPHVEGSTFTTVDPWMQCIAMFVSKNFAMTTCPLAIAHAWPIVAYRLNALYNLLDPKQVAFCVSNYL